MRPIQHASNNLVLGAPKDWDQKELPVRALPVTRVMYEGSGARACWSYWRPTEEERLAIAGGAAICLSVMGDTQPPVSLGVDGLEFEDW